LQIAPGLHYLTIDAQNESNRIRYVVIQPVITNSDRVGSYTREIALQVGQVLLEPIVEWLAASEKKTNDLLDALVELLFADMQRVGHSLSVLVAALDMYAEKEGRSDDVRRFIRDYFPAESRSAINRHAMFHEWHEAVPDLAEDPDEDLEAETPAPYYGERWTPPAEHRLREFLAADHVVYLCEAEDAPLVQVVGGDAVVLRGQVAELSDDAPEWMPIYREVLKHNDELLTEALAFPRWKRALEQSREELEQCRLDQRIQLNRIRKTLNDGMNIMNSVVVSLV
jgi:hypothetical protein